MEIHGVFMNNAQTCMLHVAGALWGRGSVED